MKCKGAIFDMDGLLFDTEQVYQDTWHEIAAERGIVLGEGYLKAISGTSGSHMCHVIESYYHVSDGTDIMNECLKRVRKSWPVMSRSKKGLLRSCRHSGKQASAWQSQAAVRPSRSEPICIPPVWRRILRSWSADPKSHMENRRRISSCMQPKSLV